MDNRGSIIIRSILGLRKVADDGTAREFCEGYNIALMDAVNVLLASNEEYARHNEIRLAPKKSRAVRRTAILKYLADHGGTATGDEILRDLYGGHVNGPANMDQALGRMMYGGDIDFEVDSKRRITTVTLRPMPDEEEA